MIFISHTKSDKSLVEPIAEKVAEVFGEQNVFYDSWSIQPGDGIISKMNEALSNCKFFFFFVSKNSLNSKLVELEWQNAIIKTTKGQTKLIPVKLDDCMMPEVMLQTLYIDLFGQGAEVAIRQIIDVIKGNSTYRKSSEGYQNIRGYVSQIGNSVKIEFKAETYMEPQSKFAILLGNNQEDITWKLEGITYPTNFLKDYKVGEEMFNVLQVARAEATSPGFPLVVNITSKNNQKIVISGLMHAKAATQYKDIPIIQGGA